MTRTDKTQIQDAQHHDRRLGRRLDDPEFRAAFERERAEIAMVDEIVNGLEQLRDAQDITKAELARAIGKNPASIRRLLTARGNPEVRTIVALANALDADVKLVPRNTPRGSRRQQDEVSLPARPRESAPA